MASDLKIEADFYNLENLVIDDGPEEEYLAAAIRDLNSCMETLIVNTSAKHMDVMKQIGDNYIKTLSNIEKSVNKVNSHLEYVQKNNFEVLSTSKDLQSSIKSTE